MYRAPSKPPSTRSVVLEAPSRGAPRSSSSVFVVVAMRVADRDRRELRLADGLHHFSRRIGHFSLDALSAIEVVSANAAVDDGPAYIVR